MNIVGNLIRTFGDGWEEEIPSVLKKDMKSLTTGEGAVPLDPDRQSARPRAERRARVDTAPAGGCAAAQCPDLVPGLLGNEPGLLLWIPKADHSLDLFQLFLAF